MGCTRGGGETQEGSENILRILLLEFGGELDMGDDKKKEVKDDFKVVGLSNQKNRVAIC